MKVTNLSSVLARPLILGASVSADFASLSPGRRLALRHTSSDHIRTYAKGGRTGLETVATLPASAVADRTVVIGVDTFFWDSGLPDPRPSVAALHTLVAKAGEIDAPLVLGDIPEILPGAQHSRAALNEAISKAGARVLPLDGMFQELRRTGSLLVGGRRLTWRQIAPDGLHIGAEASEFLADAIAALLQNTP